MKKLLFALLFSLVYFINFAQNDAVLFTVDNDTVLVSEFKRVYNKNLELVQDETQKDVDEYLKLYINYKLKLREAKEKGLDKKPSYLREFNNYKQQLLQNYLVETEVTDALLQEAYYRTANEVNADHILIRLDASATPEDTLKAYNKLLKLRDDVLKEGYDVVQKRVHDGQHTFAENLGYFTAFKMVYPFETITYNTKVGEVSLPFKTQFGYHIIKVNDRRKSDGHRKVAHIMISNKQNDSLTQTPKQQIDAIYQKLNQGAKFNDLAKQFSQDKASASKGGKLRRFTRGELNASNFEDQAFNLKNIGDISEPFKTAYGWHIVKLLNIEDVPSFEKLKRHLVKRVERDSRSKLINDSRIEKLKQKYKVSSELADKDYFMSVVNDDILHGKWKLPDNYPSDKTLLTINNNKVLTYNDFGKYIVKQQRKHQHGKTPEQVLNDVYNSFLSKELLLYQENNLEYENLEYASIVKEYQEGLLLFDLMENEIWNTSKIDTVALEAFYNTHKSNYTSEEKVDAIVASSSNKNTLKKVAKLLKKGKSPDKISKSINKNGKINVLFKQDIMEKDDQALPKNIHLKSGVSKIIAHNGAFVVVKINTVFPKTQQSFKDAKGSVISDYQIAKEKQWLAALADKYPVNVNQDVLNKVKSQIQN